MSTSIITLIWAVDIQDYLNFSEVLVLFSKGLETAVLICCRHHRSSKKCVGEVLQIQLQPINMQNI